MDVDIEDSAVDHRRACGRLVRKLSLDFDVEICSKDPPGFKSRFHVLLIFLGLWSQEEIYASRKQGR